MRFIGIGLREMLISTYRYFLCVVVIKSAIVTACLINREKCGVGRWAR